MLNDWLNWGWFDLPLWGIAVAVAAMCHITLAAVTIYLHRCQAHRALDLHPVVSHFFRFWLWLTTGMRTIEWVAVHRKHHAFCEVEQDPHSPVVYGVRQVLLEGAELYRSESSRQDTLDKYGHETPDDWIENTLYAPLQIPGRCIYGTDRSCLVRADRCDSICYPDALYTCSGCWRY